MIVTEPKSSIPQSESSAYARRVVGFVDILGFADLVRRAAKETALRDEIVEVLGRVIAIQPPGSTETDLRTQYFSDSLILSAQFTPDGLWHLLLSLDALSWNLLQMGVMVRGAVTIGEIHHDDRFVFGVGVNEAYRLESTVANFPRIILSREAFTAAESFAADNEIYATYRESRLRRDTDGVWFLNYLNEIGCFNRQDPTHTDSRDSPFLSVGHSVQTILQQKIDSTLDRPDVYAKVEWLARFWNEEVVAVPDGSPPPLIGPVILAGMEARGPGIPFRAH